MTFFGNVHHRNLSSFRPQDYACAFTSEDHRKSYTPLLFCLPHIKVKNTPEDKVKYENMKYGYGKRVIELKISQSDNNGLPKSIVKPCEVS